MPGLPTVAPVLSTPDTAILEASAAVAPPTNHVDPTLLDTTYEIPRTIEEIKRGGWKRIALQFPDCMLPDAPRVAETLQRGLWVQKPEQDQEALDGVEGLRIDDPRDEGGKKDKGKKERVYILADTSYGACCVDEIAAEHVDADVVVHYGRACLSPTARLPVIHVFTIQELDLNWVVEKFKETFRDKKEKVVLMADVTYASHIPILTDNIRQEGYENPFETKILHNPSSMLPNRTVPEEVKTDFERLKEWSLFHISDPPPALLLTLSSRVKSIYILPTSSSTNTSNQPILATTTRTLRRRYALLTSLSTVPIFGILINTLSISNYLSILKNLQTLLSSRGKKSYTFVVGKINAAKIANLSEIGGWVVIGCWESSLIEDKEFWKPVITPFELELCLQGDNERVWTGEWRGDWDGVAVGSEHRGDGDGDGDGEGGEEKDYDDEEESAPPEFDLRTGRYVANSRPMRKQVGSNGNGKGVANGHNSLIKRTKGEVATIGGELSPGAEFLRTQRTWRGLGSDFEIAYDESGNEPGVAIEQGRSGIARGYVNESRE